jgi:hypothetical protein
MGSAAITALMRACGARRRASRAAWAASDDPSRPTITDGSRPRGGFLTTRTGRSAFARQPIDGDTQGQLAFGVFAGRSGDDQPGIGITGGVDQFDERASPTDLDFAVGSDFCEELANILLGLSVGSALEHHAGNKRGAGGGGQRACPCQRRQRAR